MSSLTPTQNTEKFKALVTNITDIGRKYHSTTLVEHAKQNLPYIQKTIKDLKPLSGKKTRSGIVVSAGPSLRKRKTLQKIVESNYSGTIIAIDGSYTACLKAGIIPDYVLSLDPHPTRIVRWFGDPQFEEHTKNDDYFERQDLDIDFRKNTIRQNEANIRLVNEKASLTKAIVASTAPMNVVQRMKEAKFECYGWNPLVDDPSDPKSITREMYDVNRWPCMNTGGTVGTAAWVFASVILKLPVVSIVGMDFGYYADVPITQTQTYYELLKHVGNHDDLYPYFVEATHELTGETFYTDPTYFWYMRNFLNLLKHVNNKTINCTEGGMLNSQLIPNSFLDDFLTTHSA